MYRLKRYPKPAPTPRPMSRNGEAKSAQRRPSYPSFTRKISEVRVASSIAAHPVLRPRVTIAMANPAQNGTSRNITSPIPLVLGVFPRKKPPSPTHMPVAVPRASPLKMLRRSFSVDLFDRNQNVQIATANAHTARYRVPLKMLSQFRFLASSACSTHYHSSACATTDSNGLP